MKPITSTPSKKTRFALTVVAAATLGAGATAAAAASTATPGANALDVGLHGRAADRSVAVPTAVTSVSLGAKVSEQRIDRTVFEYVYKLNVVNGAQATQGVLVKLVSGGTGTTVVQGTVFVGDMAAAAATAPAGTVTIRQDRSYAFDPSALVFGVSTFSAPSAATCAALANNVGDTALFPAATVVISATLVAAAGTTPEHCNVLGTIAQRVGAQSSPGITQNYAIRWQVRLPTTWNGKFVMEGGGGTDGSIPATTSRLSAGYAMAANDSGHSNTINNDPLAGGTGTFGTDHDARVDFAYRAIDRTQQTAKGLMALFYDQQPAYAYFEGCSMGGREAMMVPQRLPNAFNGVVAGDPAIHFASMLTHAIYESQVFGALATSMGLFTPYGLPLVNNTYTNQDLQLVSKAVLDTCDAMDGLADGIVNKPLQCTTAAVAPKLDAVRCTGAKTATCLSAAQIDAFKTVYTGPVTPSGVRPYYGWMWDPGIAGCTSTVDCNTPTATNIATGWRSWVLGAFAANPATATNTALDFSGGTGGAAATVIVPTPPVLPAPTANEGTTQIVMNFNIDDFVARSHGTSSQFPVSGYDLLETASTNLSTFAGNGGKLIIYQPQTGGPFSPLAMVDWYEKLNLASGGSALDYSRAQQYARLFMMPGAQHCGGGPSTSTIDAFTSVVQWVENGAPPAQIIGTAPAATPWPGRTRPLCPYPAYARYNGSGSIESAANFSCAVDPPPDPVTTKAR